MPGARGKGALVAPERIPRSGAGPALSITVDLVIFTVREAGAETASDAAEGPRRRGSRELAVLLVKRSPGGGRWSLPGGPLRLHESLDEAARRELREDTHVKDIYLEQLYTFGNPRRDPAARVVSVSYFALIAAGATTPPPAPLGWHPVNSLPPLALDHERIIEYAISRLKSKLEYTTVGFQLLPSEFSLSELQRVYEVILGRDLDKRNFRKKMLSLGILRELSRRTREGAGRPARLFAFAEDRFVNLKDKGIIFPF